MLKASEDDHNILRLGLGLAASDLSPSARDKLKSDFGGRFPALEIRRLSMRAFVRDNNGSNSDITSISWAGVRDRVMPEYLCLNQGLGSTYMRTYAMRR